MNQEIKQIEELEKLLSYEGEDRDILAEELLAEVQERNKGKIRYNTQYKALNDLTGGFRRGQLVVISAATGEGKTTLAQNFTAHFVKEGYKCLWFSYEVGIEEFMEKMPEGGKAFYVPRILRQNMLTWVEDRIKEGLAKYNTRIIFIDHLHYLLEMQKMAEAKSLSLLIGQMLRELKKIALIYDLTIFLISHLKKIEMSEKPELSDLRDSSFVAQESDIVMMMWRIRTKGIFPGEWIPSNDVRLAVRKNRQNGNLGIVSLRMENGVLIESNLPPADTFKKEEINPKDMNF